MQQSAYLHEVVCLCSPHSFGQSAIEWFVITGQVRLCYNDLEADLRTIMGEPYQPETGIYSDICEAYQNFCRGITIEGQTQALSVEGNDLTYLIENTILKSL